jgi:hypothetical protein
VKELARNVGFAIHVRSSLLYELTWQDERDIQTTYTGIPGNMLKHEYNVSRALEDGANATRLLSGQRQNGRPSQHKTTSLRYSACLYAFNARE